MRTSVFFAWTQLILIVSISLAGVTLASSVLLHADNSKRAAPPTKHVSTYKPADDPVAIDSGPWMQGYPSAAGDSEGDLFVVWEDNRDGDPHIRFAQRMFDGPWQDSVQLDATAVGEQNAPQIAVDGSGALYAVWQDDRGEATQIYFAHRPVDGAWSAGEVISPTVQAQDRPALAVDRRGAAVVSWRQGTWPDYDVFTAVRASGGVWMAGDKMTMQSVNIATTDVAFDDWGRAYLAWGEWNTGKIAYRERSPEGVWSTEEQIRDNTVNAPWGIQIETDDAANLHAVWEDGRNGGSQIFAAYRPAGGPWSANVRIDDGNGDMWSPGLAIDGAGNAIAAWSRENTDVYGSIRYLGSGWTESELWVEAPTLSTAAIERTPASVSPNATTSWTATLNVIGPAGTIISVGSGLFGDLNIMESSLEPPGSMGCRGMAASTADVQGLTTPTIFAPPGFCHAGNAFQVPTNNADEGSFVDFLPQEGGGYAIGEREIDGQTIYVVMGDGYDGAFSDQGDAERFALEHETANLLDFYQGADGNSPSGPEPDMEPTQLPDLFPDSGDIFPGDGGSFLGDLFAGIWGDTEQPPAEDSSLPPDTSPPSASSGTDSGDIFPGAGDNPLGDLFDPTDSGGSDDASTVTDQNDDAQAPQQMALRIKGVAEWLFSAGVERDYFTQISLDELSASFSDMSQEDWNWLYEEKVAHIEHVMELADELVSLTGSGNIDPEAYKASLIGGVLGKVEPYQQQALNNLEQEVQQARAEHLSGDHHHVVDPVLLHSGEFVHNMRMLHIPGRGLNYALDLSYHSQFVYDGPLGWGWEHSYDRRIVDAGAGSLALKTGGGRFDVYSFDGAIYTPPAGRYTALVSEPTGIIITDRYGMVETYLPLDDTTAPGALKSINDRNGNALMFDYDALGRLQTVTETLGREIMYGYDAEGRISTITDFSGREVKFEYDVNGDLVGVTSPAVAGTPHGNDFPTGKTTRFEYSSSFEDERLNHNLTAIIAPNEVADGSLTPRTINTYGEDGLVFDRIVSQSWGGSRANGGGASAGGDVSLNYSTAIAADDPPGAAGKTTITDRGGNVTEFWHDGAGHRLQARRSVGGTAHVTAYVYNADGLMTGIEYPAGNRIEFAYDDDAADRLAQGNLWEMRRVADTARGCDGSSTSSGQALVSAACPDQITTYTYEPTFQLLQSATDSRGNTTTRARDANGNLVGVDYPDISDGPTAPQTAGLSWTYNAFGQPLSFTDTEGHVTNYEYYDTGPATGYRKQIVRDVGGLGVTTEFEYDTVGNITAIVIGRGIRSEYEINTLNQVVQKITAASHNTQHATRYWYDANDNLVQVDVENVAPDLDADFHPTGSYSRDTANPWISTSFSYDLLDNMVARTAEVSETAQITTEYRYDAQERLLSVIEPKGNRTEYDYDERSLLREMNRGADTPEEATTTYVYDANGKRVRTKDGEGKLTDFIYDGFDRLVGQVDALGNITRWGYDANGNVLYFGRLDGQDGRNPGRVIDASDAVLLSYTEYDYDERNRRYQTRRQFFGADVGSGTLTPITLDGNGDGWMRTLRTFDRNGNLTALNNDNGDVTVYGYDGLDRLILYTDALNNTVGYSYDDTDNLVQTVATDLQPEGLISNQTFTTAYAYDAQNRLTKIEDNGGHTSRFAYDGRDNLVFVSDANGPVDDESNGHGNTILFTYDGQNRLIGTTRHLREGGVGGGSVIGQVNTTVEFDDNDNIVAATDANGNDTTYSYDVLDRPVGVTHADGTSSNRVYNRAHSLVQRTDANGNVFDFGYDDLHRLVETEIDRAEGVGGTTMQTFGWDGLSRLQSATDNNDPAVPADDSAVGYSYDSLGNRLSETQNGDTSTSTYDGMGNRLTLAYPSGKTVTYSYDALNRLETVAAGGPLAEYDYIGPGRVLRRMDGNGIYAEYAYDDARRLIGINYRKQSDDSLMTGFGYSYDRTGNILSEMAQPGDVLTTYAYDSLYRLSEYQRPGLSQVFEYDQAGNRTQEIRNERVIDYEVDNMNRYTRIDGYKQSYDANGNLVQGENSYGYDALNRLIHSEDILRPIFLPLMTGSGSGAGSVQAALAQPLQFTPRASQHSYDALNRRVLRATGDDVIRFVYVNGRIIEERDQTDALLGEWVGALLMERGGTHSHYQTDARGSVRALADDAGIVLEREDYEAFGKPIDAESVVGNPNFYRGSRYDLDDGLYVFSGWRYDPYGGQVLQR